jgi:hypothetical protein
MAHMTASSLKEFDTIAHHITSELSTHGYDLATSIDGISAFCRGYESARGFRIYGGLYLLMKARNAAKTEPLAKVVENMEARYKRADPRGHYLLMAEGEYVHFEVEYMPPGH